MEKEPWGCEAGLFSANVMERILFVSLSLVRSPSPPPPPLPSRPLFSIFLLTGSVLCVGSVELHSFSVHMGWKDLCPSSWLGPLTAFLGHMVPVCRFQPVPAQECCGRDVWLPPFQTPSLTPRPACAFDEVKHFVGSLFSDSLSPPALTVNGP